MVEIRTFTYLVAKSQKYIEVIPVNWTQKFEPHGGQISKP